MVLRPIEKRFDRVLLFVAAFAIFFAAMDVIGWHMWDSVGEGAAEAYIAAEGHYMIQFWSFAYAMIAVAAIIYYMMRSDLSEAVAIVVAGLFTIWSGIEDALYFWFRGLPIPDDMYWLIDTPIGTVARIMGLETVTVQALFLNIGLFAVAGFFITSWLFKQKW